MSGCEQTATRRAPSARSNATITWSTDGIKQTIQDSIPVLGGFVSGVKTNPSDGTIELQGALGSDHHQAGRSSTTAIWRCRCQQLTGLGFTLPRETVQPALDAFTAQLTKNYPLGIKADSVTGHRHRCDSTAFRRRTRRFPRGDSRTPASPGL